MRSKRGIELSVNFIVTMVLALTIFGFGIMFIRNLSSEASDITDITLTQIDDRIGSILCDGSDRICIAKDRIKIEKGDHGFFGVKVLNILQGDEKPFTLLVSRGGGFSISDSPIVNTLDFKPETRSFRLSRNKEIDVGIVVSVPKNAESGTYIFDVTIPEPAEYSGEIHKLYVEVP